MQAQVAPDEGFPELVLDLQRFIGMHAHLVFEDAEHIAPGELGPRERGVCRLRQLIEVTAMLREAGDADARGNAEPLRLQLQGLGDATEQAFRHLDGACFANAGKQEEKLVSPHAAQRGLQVQLGAQAARQRGEHSIPHREPERFVDQLETVEIDIEQCQRRGTRGSGGHRQARPLVQQFPIGQACERVVVAEEADAVPVVAMLGNIGGDTTERVDLAFSVIQRDFHRPEY